MEDLREHERVPVDVEIQFRYPNRFLGQMYDYSIGGMRARVPRELKMDSPVEMEIFNGNILASGHVRWLKIDGDHVTVGIQFREGEQELIAQIKDWKGRLA